jgi:hypothetical protein
MCAVTSKYTDLNKNVREQSVSVSSVFNSLRLTIFRFYVIKYKNMILNALKKLFYFLVPKSANHTSLDCVKKIGDKYFKLRPLEREGKKGKVKSYGQRRQGRT